MIPVIGPTRWFDVAIYFLTGLLYLIELVSVSVEEEESVFLRRYFGTGLVLNGIVAGLGYIGAPRMDFWVHIFHGGATLMTLVTFGINAGLWMVNAGYNSSNRAVFWLFIAAIMSFLLFLFQVATFFI